MTNKDVRNEQNLKRQIQATFVKAIVFLLTILGLIGILGEFGLISRYFEHQLNNTILKITLDADFLKKEISRDKLREMRAAITEALYDRGIEIENGPGSYIDFIENTIYPMIDYPWRKDLSIYLEHQIIDDINTEKYIDVYNSIKWKYVSYYDTVILDRGSFLFTMDTIPGFKNEELFKVEKFIAGKDILDLSVNMDTLPDGRIEFQGQFFAELRDGDEVVMTTRRKIPYRCDVFTFWMNIPTKGFELFYKHPENFFTRIYVFGLGLEQPELVESTANRNVWKYDGWLLKKHGVYLSWIIGEKE